MGFAGLGYGLDDEGPGGVAGGVRRTSRRLRQDGVLDTAQGCCAGVHIINSIPDDELGAIIEAMREEIRRKEQVLELQAVKALPNGRN